MTSAVVGTGTFAPSFSVAWLWIGALLAVAAVLTFVRTRDRLLPPRPEAADVAGALRSDAPAVVNLLTNDATVTAAGFRATLIDLAVRGWLRILPPEDDLDELARVRPAATAYQGDALRPHERLVLQHVMARFTTDRAIPARFLAVDIRGNWWRRFNGLVIDEAVQAGLVRRRWSPNDLFLPGGLWAAGVLCWYVAWATGDSEVAVIDSVGVRIVGWTLAAVLVGFAVVVARLWLHPLHAHRERGRCHTAMARRSLTSCCSRLRRSRAERHRHGRSQTGLRDRHVPGRRCRNRTAAGAEDHHRAWSSVGGRARLVRVTYPVRVGYGMAPFTAIGVGLIVCFVGLRLRAWSSDVARRDAFDWIYDRFPAQDWLITDVATTITFLAFLPIVIGFWMAVAGAFDGFNSVERTGAVIRTRRPAEVSPLPRRLQRVLESNRYHVYVAVDDGSSDTIVAWKTGERHAIPQGARASVTATPALGHIRRANPVGHVLVE